MTDIERRLVYTLDGLQEFVERGSYHGVKPTIEYLKYEIGRALGEARDLEQRSNATWQRQ